MDHLFDIFILIFAYASVWYGLSLLLKNSGIADIAWGLGFCLIAAYCWITVEPTFPGAFVVLIMVFLWGFRLAGYIFWRGLGKAEDWRYKKWRDDWGKTFYVRSYLQVFLLQGFLMILVSFPVINIITSQGAPSELGWVEVLGVGLWLIGFLWETISDFQLYFFKKNPANKGKIMTTGLWAYSRHPNYFGEILLWFGVLIFSLPYGNQLTSLFGFLVITFLVVKVSGVAMLEKKYVDNEDYQDYIKRTWALIPKLF